MTYEWILFDVDGTLLDFESSERRALERAWADAELAPHPSLLQTYREINSKLWHRFEAGEVEAHAINELRFQELTAELAELTDSQALSSSFLEALAQETHLLPGAEELLQTANTSSRVGLLTNGLAVVQRPRLSRSSIAESYELLLISEEIGYAKPDRRIFEAAHLSMGSPAKDRVLMVGDNLRADVGGAANFGYDTCWINLDGRNGSKEIQPTHQVQRLDSLTQWLKNRSAELI